MPLCEVSDLEKQVEFEGVGEFFIISALLFHEDAFMHYLHLKKKKRKEAWRKANWKSNVKKAVWLECKEIAMLGLPSSPGFD